MRVSIAAFVGLTTLGCATALAAPVNYEVDTKHAHVGFAADHFGGLSVWRGVISGATGKIVLDQDAGTGTVDITLEPGTVVVGRSDLEDHLKTAEFFDVAKFPTAHFVTTGFRHDGNMVIADGQLTLRGVTKPVSLAITAFRCGPHPMNKKQMCGANATTTIKRSEFGLSTYVPAVGDEVTISIEVEAVKD